MTYIGNDGRLALDIPVWSPERHFALGTLFPRVILVRHACTPANADRTAYAHTANEEMGLRAEGPAQAEAVGQKLGEWFARNNIKSATVWTSDYQRAIDTEAFASPGYGIQTTLHRSHELREIDYGICDGMPEDEMWAKYRTQLTQYENDKFNHARPGGESRRQVLERFEEFMLGTALPQMTRPHSDVLVIFSHSVTQRAGGMSLTGSPPSFFQENNPNNCAAWLIENGRMSVLFEGFKEPKQETAPLVVTPEVILPLNRRAFGSNLAVAFE